MVGKPYIGVTGITTREQALGIFSYFQPPQGLNRLLMLGVLVSETTLQGKENKYPNRYPKIGEIGEIFFPGEDLLNLVHYHNRTENTADLCEQLSRITKLAGPYFNGFQLNITWPPVSELIKFHKREPFKFIVFQVNNGVMDSVKHNPYSLESRIKEEYIDGNSGLIDYILLDPSGGQGKRFDLNKTLQTIEVLRELNLPLVVAGGLRPGNLFELLPGVCSVYPDISIDAEGGLRDNPKTTDDLNLSKVHKYINTAVKIFTPVNSTA
ncbi:hypothetical protein ACFLZS_01495 [Patescibacteria group bacterium]